MNGDIYYVNQHTFNQMVGKLGSIPWNLKVNIFIEDNKAVIISPEKDVDIASVEELEFHQI